MTRWGGEGCTGWVIRGPDPDGGEVGEKSLELERRHGRRPLIQEVLVQPRGIDHR